VSRRTSTAILLIAVIHIYNIAGFYFTADAVYFVAKNPGVSVGYSGSNLSTQIHFGHPAKITESVKGHAVSAILPANFSLFFALAANLPIEKN
jgi:hypothetical protein